MRDDRSWQRWFDNEVTIERMRDGGSDEGCAMGMPTITTVV